MGTPLPCKNIYGNGVGRSHAFPPHYPLLIDNAPVHKSLVAQQALCDCEFVQLNHPAYTQDLAPSDYFLIRNLTYSRCGNCFIDDESLMIAVEAWSEGQDRKFYFQCINSREKKLKKMH